MIRLVLIQIFFIGLTIAIEDLPISNFDVRQKFSDCYNDGVSENYNEITCYTNWPIQFAMILTDKICIKKKQSKRLLSSMNINSCMKLNDEVQNCRILQKFYNTTDLTFQTVNETIKYFNKNGVQYLDEFPYRILQDDETAPGYFPNCVSYTSSVNTTVNENYQILDENIEENYFSIKMLIYNEGPILAYLDTNRKDILSVEKAIYFPETITSLNHDGIKFLRVIGWRTLNNKLFWIFSYTLDEDWGLGNYKLIPQKDFKLKFLNLQLN